VYDFSEEYIVRKPGFTGPECVVHHIILGSGIYNIEYVTNLHAITRRVVTIMALPLKLVGVESAPARVIAIEE
jgi:arylformamidase